MAEGNARGCSFSTIDGAPLPLDRFRGKPVLLVNTASFCGYTPQYADLEQLHQRYAGRGLVVLGVPSNDFGAQEPGTAAEIVEFCSTNYHVTFPMTAKERVLGPEAHPFYRWIEAELGDAGVPRWNFHKYLIAPDGSLAGAWPSAVKPLAAEIIEEIERLLAP
jgi:glutathione peroxidase